MDMALARPTSGPMIETHDLRRTFKTRSSVVEAVRGVDLTVIALWLGHESTETTQVYLHADMRIKERALAHATPSGVTPKRYRPPDPLLAFLEGL
jgi:integrase